VVPAPQLEVETGKEGREESGACTTTGSGDRKVEYEKHLREK